MTDRRARRRGRGGGAGEDETVGLAGWMYTDLLLGLAVVFLGSIAFAITATGQSPDDDGTAGPPASTTTTSSTTSTTTIPPEICDRLYSPTASSADGFTVDLRGRQSDDQLAAEFQRVVEAEISEQNSRIEDLGLPFPPFAFESLQVSIVMVSGDGVDSYSGNALAMETTERLKSLFPDQLGLTVIRPIWSRRTGSNVRIELFPTVSAECTVLRAAEAAE